MSAADHRVPAASGSPGNRRVVILGSTGSIGVQALDIVARNRDRFSVVALAAGGSDVATLAAQAVAFDVPIVVVADASVGRAVREAVAAERIRRGGTGPEPTVLAGQEAVVEAAGIAADVVLNGIAGAAGLGATLAALAAGSVLALANKESLIVGGPLVKAAAGPGQIVPVDSEHSALAQALRGGRANEVGRLIVTASGGPFRGWSADQLATVSVEQALAHPTWSMGPLVTVNSATLMNKGLEVIEAHLLFDIPLDRIDVVVHPQSIVHSMVEFVDGSTLAQASPPDMRLPIALGLAWPDRVPDAISACDWTTATAWEFFPLDDEVFPAVRLARRVGSVAGTAPAAMNAADEVCVEAFLTGNLAFDRIVPTVAAVVEDHLAGGTWVSGADATVADVFAVDSWARARARHFVESGARGRVLDAGARHD